MRGKARKKVVTKENRCRLDDSEITDKTTPFYDATVVITGTFDAFPERNEIARRIQLLGAKTSSSISKKTTIVIMGDGAGPKKIEKVNELNADGWGIYVMRETELLKYIGDK